MNNKTYPAKKIIGWFTLLGGGIGGVLIGLGFMMGFLIEWITYDRILTIKDFGGLLVWLGLTFMFGTIAGFVPAGICACIIVWYEMTLDTPKIYPKLFLIGASIIIVPALIIGIGALIIFSILDLYYFSDFSFLEHLKNIIGEGKGIFMVSILSLVSGLTAMILGKFTLPKN